MDEEDRKILRALSLPTADHVDSVARRLFAATDQDLATYRGGRQWPVHALALNLVLNPAVDPQPIALEGLAEAIGITVAVNLVSDPGTGKTTTLVQLGEAVAAAELRFRQVAVQSGDIASIRVGCTGYYVG